MSSVRASNIGTRKFTKEEKQFYNNRRRILVSVGAMPNYDLGTAKLRPEKRLSAERFSTNYKTREEFEKDREEIFDYLERMEYPPEDLVTKVSETVKELDLQFGD